MTLSYDPQNSCAIYARVAHESTEEIDRQVAACAFRASELDREVHHLFVDNGASGMEIGPSLQRLLEMARFGSFGHLIVQDQVRLAKSVGLRIFVLTDLATAGVKVEMLSERTWPYEPNVFTPGLR
ncbi:hypothetical protein XH90_09340 [Bradyrhizobium sp. CCBAU 53338]|nr:hypothetical protein XH90_09340 [Bradyrhizobium sp. CCBAU 53338]